MFYSDYCVKALPIRTSNYILRFARHFDQYVNSVLVRSIDLNEIVWC